MTIQGNRFLSKYDANDNPTQFVWQAITLMSPRRVLIANNYFDLVPTGNHYIALYNLENGDDWVPVEGVYISGNIQKGGEPMSKVGMYNADGSTPLVGRASVVVEKQSNSGIATVTAGSTEVVVSHLLYQNAKAVVCSPTTFITGAWRVVPNHLARRFAIFLEQAQSSDIDFYWYATT